MSLLSQYLNGLGGTVTKTTCRSAIMVAMLLGFSQKASDAEWQALDLTNPIGTTKQFGIWAKDVARESVDGADWIPGDWGEVQNTAWVQWQKDLAAGHAGTWTGSELTNGENLIYLGGGEYWGLVVAGKGVKRRQPLKGFKGYVATWGGILPWGGQK